MICTFTAVAVPTNSFFGVKVIVCPTLSKTYTPWFVVTVFVSAPEASNNVNVSVFNSTCSPEAVTCGALLKLTVCVLFNPSSSVFNTILDTCCFPWTSLVVAASAKGSTGTTLGAYVASFVTVISLSSLSCATTTGTEIPTGFGLPLKSTFGVKVTSPVSGTIL